MRNLFCSILLFAVLVCHAQTPSDDLQVTKESWTAKADQKHLTISVTVSPDHYLYAETTSPMVIPSSLKLLKKPEAKSYFDPFFEKNMNIYQGPGTFTWVYNLVGTQPPYEVSLIWQECRSESKAGPGICYMPQSVKNIEVDYSAASLPVMPESWSADIKDGKLMVSVKVSKNHYLYADATAPILPEEYTLLEKPPVTKHKDAFLNAETGIYPGPGTFTWIYDLKGKSKPTGLSLQWQECSGGTEAGPGICYMPQKIDGSYLFPDTSTTSEPLPLKSSPQVKDEFAPYRLLRSGSYMDKKEFLEFLTQNETGPTGFSFSGKNIFMVIILAVLGGLLLNLTPCVLPLIPVNLAIIGAGADNEKGKSDRILRGLSYGLGIAFTYGLLGLIAVLAGTTFGGINSSWIFNIAVALVFFILALAMFDVFNLDFSRYETKIKMPSSARYAGVFLMGSLSAVLAGACVAPVLVAALLYASTQYAQGNYTGLLIPFLLGVGMALPWPFAAAGLSLFPKPGKWMVHVKHVIGILIILLGIYYAYLGTTLFISSHASISAKNQDPESGIELINNALSESAKTGKPVLIDFWATWCKNCKMMEMRTLSDPEVKKEMENFIVLKLQTENASHPVTARILKEFQLIGIPAFVILEAEK